MLRSFRVCTALALLPSACASTATTSTNTTASNHTEAPAQNSGAQSEPTRQRVCPTTIPSEGQPCGEALAVGDRGCHYPSPRSDASYLSCQCLSRPGNNALAWQCRGVVVYIGPMPPPELPESNA